jgi:hypothetical protein
MKPVYLYILNINICGEGRKKNSEKCAALKTGI